MYLLFQVTESCLLIDKGEKHSSLLVFTLFPLKGTGMQSDSVLLCDGRADYIVSFDMVKRKEGSNQKSFQRRGV